MQSRFPVPVGVTEQPQLAESRIARAELKIGQAKRLAELHNDYIFFTPGIVFTQLMLQSDPFDAFPMATGTSAVLYSFQFDYPIFQGLDSGGGGWNNVIYAVDKEYWENFYAYCYTLAFVDRRVKLYAKIQIDPVRIADPIYMQSAKLSTDIDNVTVDIWELWLDTNKGAVKFEPSDSPLPRPVLKHYKECNPQVLHMANAVFSDVKDPFKHVEEAMSDESHNAHAAG